MVPEPKYLKITGAVLVPLLFMTSYISIRNKKRDRLASELLKTLQTRLHPTTLGLDAEKALDPNYKEEVLSRTTGRVLVLQKGLATNYAKQLKDAFAPWYLGGDNEEAVYGILRNLKDKVQVSQVAEAYGREYQISLKDQLKNSFDKEEIKKVLRIIKPLPIYRVG